MALTPRVEAWRARGEQTSALGHQIQFLHRPGGGPALLLLHGFPSSSYDWRHVLDAQSEREALCFDFLGFGLSEKPRDHDYSLLWQADLAADLAKRCLGRPCLLVAHDMGTSVATELIARDIEGRLDFELAGALLFNGSIFQERAQLTLGQRLLHSPIGPLAARLSSERFFHRQFASIFSPDHPLEPEEAADQWALLRYNAGQRIGHRLVRYIDERKRHRERWHGALRAWPKPLSFLWGMRDPVAVPAILDGLRELRPAAPVTELADVGHYAQIEAPERVAAAVGRALEMDGSAGVELGE